MISALQLSSSKLVVTIDQGFKSAAKLISSLAHKALLNLINMSLLSAASWSFKLRLNKQKIQNSWDIFSKTGIVQQESSIPSWKFSHANMKQSFEKLGCSFTQKDAHHFDVSFDLSNKSVIDILQKYHIEYTLLPDNGVFKMACPQNKTVIYCPGSGHIFEFRKQTIGYLTIQCGFDLTCFYYPGVQSHKGPVNQDSLQSCVENVLEHELQDKSENDIILYGHCIGAAILGNTAKNHTNVRVIFDRSFDTISELVYSILQKKHLNIFPKFSKYLGNLAQSFYNFRLNEVISNHKRAMILYSTNDKFVPNECKDPKGSYLKGHTIIDLASSHDHNLSTEILPAQTFIQTLLAL